MSEKDIVSPMPSSGHNVPSQSRRKSKVIFLSYFLSLLLLWHFVSEFVDLDTLPTISELTGSRRKDAKIHCPQVAPLYPKQKSEELSKMEEYLTSEAFKNASVARLSGAVRIPSMSFDDLGPIGEDERWDVFYDVAEYLKNSYPLVHSTLELETVNVHGLVYSWQGSDNSLKPLLLMAHQDVVPVPESTIPAWTHPPFEGFFDGKLIWGRGAADCKNSLTGILEALELLIGAGFAPRRTVVLSFGFDEESSGGQGAGHLAPFLLQKYGKDSFAAIVDEGAGMGTAWGSTFAMPGVAEKGYIDVEIVVRMPGGHSSIPPDHNGIGVMSELITSIESHLYEPRLYNDNPLLGLLQCGAEHSSEFPPKLKKLLSNHSGKKCDKKKDKLALEAAKISLGVKYLMTTSVAVDVINGGVKVNALPERTTAIVNHRVNVGETTAVVRQKISRLAKEVTKKYNLTLHAFDGSDETPSSITLRARANELQPAPVTPTVIDPVSPYAILSGTTRALYGTQILMSPGIMTGNTDTRYYWDLSKHIFRYAPGYDPDQEGFGYGIGAQRLVNSYPVRTTSISSGA